VNTYAYAHDDPLQLTDLFGLTVKVCFYPAGITHVGFGIVGEKGTSGFYPKFHSPMAPGQIRDDPKDEPRECKEIPTNQDQDNCMLRCRLKKAANPGLYNVAKNQCTSFVRECLRECRIPTGIDGGAFGRDHGPIIFSGLYLTELSIKAHLKV
jgi:hypothetical protein